MIKCNVIDGTYDYEFNVKRLAKRIVKKVSSKLKISGKHIVSYIFVDLERIHQINKEYRDIDRPTDVISFAYVDSDINHELPVELGDVFICNEKVIEQANSYGHSVYRECAFLITHGILHLLGYDHMEKSDEEVMFKLQEEVLQELKIYR